jgi:hypothetical protein
MVSKLVTIQKPQVSLPDAEHSLEDASFNAMLTYIKT